MAIFRGSVSVLFAIQEAKSGASCQWFLSIDDKLGRNGQAQSPGLAAPNGHARGSPESPDPSLSSRVGWSVGAAGEQWRLPGAGDDFAGPDQRGIGVDSVIAAKIRSGGGRQPKTPDKFPWARYWGYRAFHERP
jgi:hypothetical protein